MVTVSQLTSAVLLITLILQVLKYEDVTYVYTIIQYLKSSFGAQLNSMYTHMHT